MTAMPFNEAVPTPTPSNRNADFDDGMIGHFAIHAVILAVYAISVAALWAFDYRPIFGSLLGWPFIVSSIIYALLAYGPSVNAVKKGSDRGIRIYKFYISPITILFEVATLVAAWMLVVHVGYSESVFA